jgi:hypothetical protein
MQQDIRLAGQPVHIVPGMYGVRDRDAAENSFETVIMVDMAMGQQDIFYIGILKMLDQGGGAGGSIDQDTIASMGTDDDIRISSPGSYFKTDNLDVVVIYNSINLHIRPPGKYWIQGYHNISRLYSTYAGLKKRNKKS